MFTSLLLFSVGTAVQCDIDVATSATSLLQRDVDVQQRTLEDDEKSLETEVRADDQWMLFEMISLTVLAAFAAFYQKKGRISSKLGEDSKATAKGVFGNPNVPAAYRNNCASDEATSAMKIRQERKATMIINSKACFPDGPQQACKVLEDMKRKGFPPNVIHYGAAIGVCAKKEWAFDVALNLLDDMKKCKVQADVVCYNAVITSCARSNQCDLAFQLLAEMVDDALVPQLVTVNAVLDACAKAGQDDKARRLLERMPAMGLTATVTTYGTVINACAKVGNWESALELLDEMDRAGVVGTIQCYSAAINACAKSARSKPALDILRMMIKRGVTPNQICWSTTINACLKGGYIDLALGLLDEMKMNGVTPDDVTYHVVIRDLKKSSVMYRDTILELQAERAQQSVKPRSPERTTTRMDLVTRQTS